MNARFIPDYLGGPGFLHAVPSAVFEPNAEELDEQADKLINETEEFFEWASCDFLADDERTMTSYFGAISPVEMIRLGVSAESTPEQCKAIFMQMRAMFIDRFLETLTKEAEKASYARMEDGL